MTWPESFLSPRKLAGYIDKGHVDTTHKPVILYGRAGLASIGVYIGQGLLRQGLGQSQSALRSFGDNFNNLNVTTQRGHAAVR